MAASGQDWARLISVHMTNPGLKVSQENICVAINHFQSVTFCIWIAPQLVSASKIEGHEMQHVFAFWTEKTKSAQQLLFNHADNDVLHLLLTNKKNDARSFSDAYECPAMAFSQLPRQQHGMPSKMWSPTWLACCFLPLQVETLSFVCQHIPAPLQIESHLQTTQTQLLLLQPRKGTGWVLFIRQQTLHKATEFNWAQAAASAPQTPLQTAACTVREPHQPQQCWLLFPRQSHAAVTGVGIYASRETLSTVKEAGWLRSPVR